MHFLIVLLLVALYPLAVLGADYKEGQDSEPAEDHILDEIGGLNLSEKYGLYMKTERDYPEDKVSGQEIVGNGKKETQKGETATPQLPKKTPVPKEEKERILKKIKEVLMSPLGYLKKWWVEEIVE